MLKNVDTPIVNLDGSTIQQKDTVVTIRDVLENALLAPIDGLTGTQKVARYRLAMAVHAGGDVEFKPEDLVLVKEAVGSTMPTLSVGQVFDWCDA